jgi:hypothetical protein
MPEAAVSFHGPGGSNSNDKRGELAMPTISCPSCLRALSLPEHADIGTARCPLCRATFGVPGRVTPSTLPGLTAGPPPWPTKPVTEVEWWV